MNNVSMTGTTLSLGYMRKLNSDIISFQAGTEMQRPELQLVR